MDISPPDTGRFDLQGVMIPKSETIIEKDSKPSEFTGILDSNGDPIYRRPVMRPPIGFVTPKQFQSLYEADPSVHTFFTTDPDTPDGDF